MKKWCVSANWVLDSKDYNEWMCEEDYEVGNNGEKKVHPHHLCVDDFYEQVQTEKANRSGAKKTPVSKSKSNEKPSVSKSESKRSTAKSREPVLPTTQCPHCEKVMTMKSLARHIREKHSEIDNLKCKFCDFTAKREDALYAHQKRIHFEPVAMGRPKKGNKHRSRSPFRVEVFKGRHKSAIETFETNLRMKDVIEKTEINLKKNDDRLKELEEAKKQKDIEFSKVKARMTILESKQKTDELPELKNIPALLVHLNLTENSSKEDIRKIINLRLMELSCESSLSREIFTSSKISEQVKQSLIMYYNEAREILTKWKKFQKKTTDVDI